MVNCWVVNLEHLFTGTDSFVPEKVYKRAVSCKLLLLMHVSIVFIYCKRNAGNLWLILNYANCIFIEKLTTKFIQFDLSPLSELTLEHLYKRKHRK